MTNVIKRNKKLQPYNVNKLEKSIYLSCISADVSPKESDEITKKVIELTNYWIEPKNEVSTNDIRSTAGRYLSDFSPHAGHLYMHHRIMW